VTLTSTLFLFAFLPIVAILYYFSSHRLRNVIIAVASLAFYLLGDLSGILILLILVIANWGFGLAIDRFKTGGRNANWIAGLAIAGNLAVLLYYKYAGFAIGTLNDILGSFAIISLPAPDIIPPLGISFMTFTAISYILDILRGDAAAYRNPNHTFIFVSLFPKVIAGPITPFKSMSNQILTREWSLKMACDGGARFILGLAKKVIIADTIGIAVNQIFSLPPDELTASVAWIGAIGFTLQLYFDFSGYSDMAIGLGRVFGFRFLENFDYPYVSTSVREFWRRWHMSLTNWFRQYLYIPLGGNRRGNPRMYMNLMIVFLLCGLWHGASWTFVIWGAWHGLFLIIERTPLSLSLKKFIVQITGSNIFIFSPLKYVYTMLVVVLGWVLFRSESLAQASGFIQVMFGFGSASAITMPGWYLSNSVIIALILGAILSFPVVPHLLKIAKEVMTRIALKTTPVFSSALTIAVSYTALVLLLLLSIMMLTTREFQPFIYAQF
jgi:alginate O-acetyltransferase complex protein AlgI